MARAFPYNGRGRVYESEETANLRMTKDLISRALAQQKQPVALSSANSGRANLAQGDIIDLPVQLGNKHSFTVPNNSSGGTRVSVGPFNVLADYGYFFLRIGWKRSTTRGTAYLSGYHDGVSVVSLKHDMGTNPGWQDLGGSISGDTVTLKLGATNSGGFAIDCEAIIEWLPAN